MSGRDYDKACIEATNAQGLGPVVVALASALIPVVVDQTGGMRGEPHNRPDSEYCGCPCHDRVTR